MKKKLTIILAICLLCACTTTRDSNTIKLAQAIKKEGDVFQSQGNYTAALAKLLDAEELTPDDPYLQNSLGLAYMGKKRYDLAVTAFKKALSKAPDYTQAINNLGAAYLRQERWDIAIVQFKRVLKDLIYPTPHFPLANIGWAYLGKREYPKAQTYFRKSLNESPGFTTAAHGLAQVYLRTGQTDRALRYLHKVLKRNPEAAILHADLAETYEVQGNRKQAIKTWKMVMTLVPENSNLARKADTRLMELQ